jgi:predicted nucleotidyltransferase
MRLEEIITLLKRYRQELDGRGVESLAIVGSAARGEAVQGSDVDLIVKLDGTERGFAHFRRLDELQARLSEILGCPVDLIEDSAVSRRVRSELEKGRVVAF